MTTDCLFCRIIRKEIPSAGIFENDKFYSFLDMSPVNFGHSLIIPKEHTETMITAKSTMLRDMMPVAKKIACAVMKHQKADGFNLCINNCKAGGQLVPHMHIHIIPRFEADSVTIDKQKTKKYLPGEMEKLAIKIKETVDSI